MQEPEVGKRIVSKGAYVRKQMTRSSNGLFGTGLYVAAVVCGFLVMLWIYSLLDRRRPESSEGVILLLLECATIVTLSAGAWLFRKSALRILKQARQLDPGVPLTRANVADLPANDSLVRASQEPAQAHEGVLLRAASGETQAGQEGQLLRAAAGGQQ